MLAASEATIPAATGEIYFTRHEAANYLRIGVATLAKRHMTGTGPVACRLGRSIRYRKTDLDAWMRDHLVRNTSDAA
jgi:excisionase family DNA binding protein